MWEITGRRFLRSTADEQTLRERLNFEHAAKRPVDELPGELGVRGCPE
jgi:hypothetical protein